MIVFRKIVAGIYALDEEPRGVPLLEPVIASFGELNLLPTGRPGGLGKSRRSVSALSALNLRFANGEIDVNEYAERKKHLVE